METIKNKIKEELKELQKKGVFIYNYISAHENRMNAETAKRLKAKPEYKKMSKPDFTFKYQSWYSKLQLVVKQVLPERYQEFNRLYATERKEKRLTNSTYSISDYLLQIKVPDEYGEERVNEVTVFLNKLEQQLGILSSCIEILDSKLYNIESALQFGLFEDELETAKIILKKGNVRVAGALAGITLERHLKIVCQKHKFKIAKQNPTISDFNEELKKNEVIDISLWRLIQRLADIRNMSVHAKDREPKIDEVEDLIRGCNKIIVEVY